MMDSFGTEYRRMAGTVTDEETGEESTIYAPMGAEDDRFDEEWTAPHCDPKDEHATLISTAVIDSDHFAELLELIEERDAAARRALRGEPAR